MSLIKQLWMAIIISMGLAFIASILVNTISSKHYLEKQLEMKNIDNAVSLALSISQMEKDPVVIDLMLSAQFDNGHYRYIRINDPNGQLLMERKTEVATPRVPTWFTSLIHISAPAGIAQIQSGWSQYGTLSLESSTEFAYADLWHSTLFTLLWSAVIAAITGLIGTLVLKVILRPLNEMVAMTEAIGDKNFITIAEPRTTEFKSLARGMNRLSGRIREMLRDQSQLLEEMRLEANYDAVTGLMNRKYFISRMTANIANEDSFIEGVLVVANIPNLAEINDKLGSHETDLILKHMGKALESIAKQHGDLIAGRINGADLAVFSNQPVDPNLLSTQVKNALLKATDGLLDHFPDFYLNILANRISRTDQLEGLRTLISTIREQTNDEEVDILELLNQSHIANYDTHDETQWQKMLTTALDSHRLKLASYPVVASNGRVIHQESPVRLQLEQDGSWVTAADFISWAIQLNLITRIDILVVEFALRQLIAGSQPIGLNVSPGAMSNPLYLAKLIELLGQHSEYAQHLWLEVPEDGVFAHLDEFRHFCRALKPLGCKIGVEHVGAQISRLGELHDLGLDYIKIDASVIRGIDSNTGNQAFLKGVCLIAHSIGLMTIAEGVHNERERQLLPSLGIDAMTGPAIQLN